MQEEDVFYLIQIDNLFLGGASNDHGAKGLVIDLAFIISDYFYETKSILFGLVKLLICLTFRVERVKVEPIKDVGAILQDHHVEVFGVRDKGIADLEELFALVDANPVQDVVLERIGNDEVVSDTGEAGVGPVHAEGSNGGEHALDVANVVLDDLKLIMSATLNKTLHIRSLEYIKIIITHGDTIYFYQVFIILIVSICLILSQTGVIYSEVINFDRLIFTYYMKAYF